MLRSRLPAIPAELEARMAAATREAAESVAEAARQRAPVRTGALQASIHVEAGDHGQKWVVTDVEYARFVEYGTVDTAPHAFMLPAAEENRQRFAQTGRQHLRNL